MNWSVTISDEPDAPGPRYRVALNIGDDYIPLEPQDTLDDAQALRVQTEILIADLCDSPIRIRD